MLACMTDEVREDRDVDPVRRQIGANVRAEMVRRQRGQDWLGVVLGLGQSQISRRLSGRLGFEARELVLVAEALAIDPGLLLKDVKTPVEAGAPGLRIINGGQS